MGLWVTIAFELFDEISLARQGKLHPVPFGAQLAQNTAVEFQEFFGLPESFRIDSKFCGLQLRRQERPGKIEHARKCGRTAAMHSEHNDGGSAPAWRFPGRGFERRD